MEATAKPAKSRSASALKGRWLRVPGLIKIVAAVAGIGACLIVLGALAGLLHRVVGPGEETTVREIPPNLLQPPVQGNGTAEAAPTADKPTLDREKLWAEVGIWHSNLMAEAQELDQEIRLARAQRWLVHAQAECAQLEQCKSPYSWLIGKYAYYKRRVEAAIAVKTNSVEGNLTLEQKMITRAETVGRYRTDLATLQDIAMALTLTHSGVMPRTFVVTADLDSALDQFSEAVASFESLRLRQSEAAYAGDDLPAENADPRPGGNR